MKLKGGRHSAQWGKLSTGRAGPGAGPGALQVGESPKGPTGVSLGRRRRGSQLLPHQPWRGKQAFRTPPPYSAPQNRLPLPRGLWWEPSLLGHVKLEMVGKHPFQVGMPLSEPVSEDQL